MTMLPLAHLSLFCLLLHVAAADDGDDFANDLFTDLSPLLALFGERVTTQFMSQSIGLADCIILAMAPLGIVTIIVSAIRVGGPALMKAIIGRARENLSAAEIELMSSTSKEVCELWNGKTIVRCPGSGNILEFVCLLPGESCSPECEIQVKPLQGATELVNLTSSSYKPNVSALKPLWQSLTSPFRSKPSEVVAASDVDARKWYKMWPPWSWLLRKTASTDEEHGSAPEEDRSHEQESNRDQTSDADIHLSDTEEQPSDTEDEPSNTETEKAIVQEITIIRDREADAPCISLNRHAQLERREVHVTAVFGTILQLAVVIYFGLITYKWPSNFQKDGDVVDSYAFPLAASGTALLVMGILLCAHVVESSTDEKYWAPTLGRKAFIIWLQQNNSVSDQLFESYAIYTGREHERIVSSRRAITDEETEKLSQQTSSEVTDKSIKAKLTLEAKTVVGTGTSLAGFVLQFIGLRGLHWSASIAQLLSIIIMTVLRAAIRRGLSKSLKTQKLMPEFELDWLAMRLSDIQTAPFFGQLKSNDTDSCSGTGDAVSSESMTTIVRDTRSTREEETEDTRPNSLRENIHQQTDTTSCYEHETPQTIVQKAMRVVRAIFDSVWLLRKQSEETEEVKWSDEDWIIATGSNQWNYTPLTPTKPHQVNCLESSDAPLVRRAPEHTQAHRTMELRKDLAKQSDWRGPASAEAVSLALAIETFMNFLYPLHERSIKHQPRSREFSWCVYVGKDRQAVELTIKWSDGSWKISAGKVDAVLSLWLYSTHAQELDRRKNRERESRTGKEDDDQWIRAKGPRPEAGLKLLGPDRGRLREDYHWWMPDEGPNCLAVRETQDQMASSTWELEIDECRVVGCARTPSEPHPAQGSKQPGKTFWHIRNAEIIESSWWKELTKDSRSEGREGLAVLTHSTLERLYAQDLFTNFVWAAAEIVQWPNESRTERASAGTKALDNLKDLRLRNNNFVRLLLKIRDTGLGSLPDVYASIISPLSLKGRLPDAALGPIVREVIQQRVASGEWLQAGEQCWWMMDSRHKSRTVQFAPIVMDFLHSLSFEIEFEKVELEYYYKTQWDIQDLEKIKQKLLRKLGKIRPEAILRGLQKLYRLKGQADEHAIPPIEGAEQGFDASDDPFLSSFKVTDLHRENFEKGSPLDFCPADNWNAGDLSGWTPLHYATARGLRSFAAELLRRRVPLDTVDCLGWTPLHHACYAGHLSIVELLVRRRASIDVTGAEGWTPLHCAVFRNHLAIVRFLRGENASVGVFDVRGWTVFHYAAYRGFREILVELGDGIPRHTQEVNARAPIHLAVMAKQQGVLDLLARDVDARDSREQTPLHLTIGQDSTTLTELLLRLGASVDAKDWINQTPLHLAATRGLNDAVKLLIQAKADVNAEDTERQKPLHNAVKWGDEGTVRLLIDAGAEVDVKGQFDQTPLHLAAERGYGDAVRLLIDEKVDVNARDWGGKTPLLLATERNANKETVELLVNAGADVNAVCEEHGHTAMHHAAKKCMADVASVMLAKDRESLKIKDKSGNLPIHYLDSPASEVMFSMFVAAGADKDATDSCGRTLLHRISRGNGSNATEFGMFLVRQGVRVDLRDKEGHTAEDYARRMSELKDLADCLHEEMERNRDERTSQEEGEGEESSHEQR